MAGVLPLSWPQEGLWFFEQAAPGTATYNIAEAWWLEGPLDVAALQSSLSEISRRHETLRTAIGAKDGKPCQIVFPPQPLPLAVTDLRGHAEAEAEAEKLAGRDARTPFDLTSEPLARVTLYQTESEKHLLVLNLHHLVSDGWSVGVFLREAAFFYEAHRKGERAQLPAPALQYGDFALWQRERAENERWREDMAYWTQQLRGVPSLLALPADRPRLAAETHRGASLFFTWPEDLAARLREAARKEGATLFQILLAAFKILLRRYTLQDDIVVGSPFSGRDEVETEELIGFFVNTHALRTDLSGNPAFGELLRRVRQTAMEAAWRQQPPLHRIVRALEGERTLTAHSLFQTAFGLQRDFTESWSLPGITATHLDLDNGGSKFDLTVLATESSRELQFRFEYSVDLFDAATVRRWARQFRLLAEGIAAQPWRRISEYSIDPPEERRRWQTQGLGLVTEYERDSCVHEIFEAQAATNPEAVALVCGNVEMSYGELNRRADSLAARLASAGAGPDQFVALCLERSLEMIVALLAILKTGAAYVPLDPANPTARHAVILQDAQVRLVLTREQWRGTIPAPSEQILCIDTAELYNEPLSRPSDFGELSRAAALFPPGGERTGRGEPEATDLAYVMYTSGSTGKPKGVAVTHRGICRLVRNTDYVRFTPEDVVLQLAPISFDASTFEIWGALLNGAQLVIHPPGMPSLEELGRFIRERKVSILWLTAGWFHQMVDAQLASLQGLRLLLAGGEALSVPHVLKAIRELRNCQLINGYGPTEGTTFTCCYRIPPSWAARASVPIGRPIANTQVYILDDSLQPVTEGAVGELYIGGDGVARGYVNRPDLTAEKFIASPFGDERLYRTGDLARWLPDGSIEFLGRKDEQLKIRGFRVEPGEVEAALSSQAGVRQAVVVPRPDKSGTKRLVAYVVLQPRADVTPAQLRHFLSVQLPPFMCPSQIVRLEKIPLTANGKVDRNALPAPEDVEPGEQALPTAPGSATEVLLVGIWQELLQSARIGIHDNFFQLGGHSLLATQVVSRLARTMGVELPVRAIFEAPTIAALARLVDAAERSATPSPSPLSPRLTQPSRAQKVLDRLDELSDDEVEELLLELKEEEIK